MPPQRQIYAVLNWVIIGAGYGLSPNSHQAITLTNADSISVECIEVKFESNPENDFARKIAFENVVCKMLTILSRPQCVIS